MLRKTLVILSLLTTEISIASTGIEFHHGFGGGAAWQNTPGSFIKYNGRMNLTGTDTWTTSISGAIGIGHEYNRPDQDAIRPYFMTPMTLDFNWGMGSTYECLRYKGYSIKLGAAISSFATTQKQIWNSNIKSVPKYIGFDYKFQTRNLRTFSIELGGLITQFNESYLEDFGVLLAFNYHFGLY